LGHSRRQLAAGNGVGTPP